MRATSSGATMAATASSGMNCIKIGLPGKSILGDYFQENVTSRRPFLLLRISFPRRPIFIQIIPGVELVGVIGMAGADYPEQHSAPLLAPSVKTFMLLLLIQEKLPEVSS